VLTCPNCGEENPERARFCLACGTPFGAAAPDEAAEERKVVSVLFVDLVGFTARSDRADPEDVRATLRPYHAMLKREIERFGGTVEKFIGDAVMAVYGAPVAHEDDAERAVRSALRIAEAIPELNEEHPELELAVRAAVNTGEAVVSLGARPERGEGIVTGDVVNTASRLQAEAPVGGVVVGEVTHRATRDVIRYEELPAVTVKGKAEPVPIWRAVEARSRFGVDVERPRTPFVGRVDDLAVLQQAFTRSRREPGVQLVTVVGEPGVGKTRLIAEFQAWVDDLPDIVYWRQGRCLPYGDGIAFWALGEVVKAHAGILESDSPEEAGRKLTEAVDLVAEERDREWMTARLAPLVGVGADTTATAERSESFAAWRGFLESVAAQSPLVLVVEDLHWADDAMLAFVDDLVDWASGVPLTVVCSARPELFEAHPGWGGGKRNSTTLSLTPLSGEDTARLIGALLEQAVLPAETQALLLERAGGNPLYAEEFVRMLVDRGILERRGQAWTVPAGAAIPVPETVQATIAARLDTLSPERKTLLQDASVVGKVFWSGAVAAMGDRDPAEVREGLHELARKELVRPARRSSVEGEAEFAFWHALVRDVAYGQLPRAARIAKHRAAADWIERLAGDRVADLAELLVHHSRQALDLAGTTGPADQLPDLRRALCRFLLLAADRVRKLDLAKAEAYLEEALGLSAEEERAAVLVQLSRVMWLRGRTRESVEATEEAIRRFEEQGDTLAALDARAFLPVGLWQLGESERSTRMLHELIDELEAQPPGKLLGLTYMRAAGNAMLAGRSSESALLGDKAVRLLREVGLEEEAVRALQFRGSGRTEMGDLGGGDDLRESLRRSVELNLPDAAAAYVNLADWVWDTEGPAAALELYEGGVEYGERRGVTGAAQWAKAQTTWALFDLGRWDEVVEAADEVIARDAWGSQVSCIPAPFRILVLGWRGRLDEAGEAVPDLLARARQIRDPQVLLPTLAAAAFVADETGGTGDALDLLRELEELVREAPPWWSNFLYEGVRIPVRAAELDLAAALADHIRPFATRVEYVRLGVRAALAEGRGDLEEALRLHREASGAWEAYGVVPEEAQGRLGEARCLVALGRAGEATSPLTRARELVLGLGAVRLVAEADDLLARATAMSS
jgi:class 3 adenylate cyclase/tetratricopeptide (TPR) repeat protein